MPALTADAVADHVQGVRTDLGEGKFEQLGPDLQNYEVMGRWLKRDKIVQDGSRGVWRNIAMGTSGNGRHHGSFSSDNTNVENQLTRLEVPWVKYENSWAYDYQDDILQARGKYKIADMVEIRDKDCLINTAEDLETAAWTLRAAANDLLPYGIPYWVVQSAAAAGFNGAAASGFTTKGGINPTTYAKWQNYTFTYTAWTKGDLLTGMRTAMMYIDWKAPVTGKDYSGPMNLRVYVDFATALQMEGLGEAQNENLGDDLARKKATYSTRMVNDVIHFRRHPVIPVAALNASAVAQNVIYMVDHATFKMYVLAGDYLRKTGPKRKDGQHNTWESFYDLQYCYLCLNPRRNAVAYRV